MQLYFPIAGNSIDILLMPGLGADLLINRLVNAFLQGRYQITTDIFVKEKSNAVEH